MTRELSLPFEPEDIALTNGAFAAISVAFRLLLDVGDEVIFSTPAWFSFGPPLAADEAKGVREKIYLSLARLEECAECGVLLAGPELTAADIVACPGLKLLLRASRHPQAALLALGLDGFETRFPGIATWMHRVEHGQLGQGGGEFRQGACLILASTILKGIHDSLTSHHVRRMRS